MGVSSYLLSGAHIQGQLDPRLALPPLLQTMQLATPSEQRPLWAAQLRRHGQDRALGSYISRERCSLPSSAWVVAPQKGPAEFCSGTNITPSQNNPQSLLLC